MDDRHKGIKRWERARQLAGLAADPERIGPLAWCRVKGLTKTLERAEKAVQAVQKEQFDQTESTERDGTRIRVYILRIYTKDLVYVHHYGATLPEGLPGPCWFVRGGIDWKTYLREVVRHYKLGLPVADPFSPLRKISPEILGKMAGLEDRDLPLVFAKLRETGFLSPFPILDRSTCPAGLAWDNVRATFQDFLETAPAKDNLPT